MDATFHYTKDRTHVFADWTLAMKSRNVRLHLESLEDRCTPATWNNPWPDAAHLTLSFAPDGTMIGGNASNLFQTLNAIAPTQTWETVILRAFQTWAAQANINLSVVADNGAVRHARRDPE